MSRNQLMPNLGMAIVVGLVLGAGLGVLGAALGWPRYLTGGLAGALVVVALGILRRRRGGAPPA
jgi:hypothetical protein